MQEANQLREALKKPEFCKLLAEYAEEISDPENKKVGMSTPIVMLVFECSSSGHLQFVCCDWFSHCCCCI